MTPYDEFEYDVTTDRPTLSPTWALVAGAGLLALLGAAVAAGLVLLAWLAVR